MKSAVDGRRAVMEEGGEGVRKSTTQKREHCLLEWGVDSDMSKHRRDMRGSEDIFKCSSSTTYIFKTEWP